MLIILEGSDLAGKSTLAKALLTYGSAMDPTTPSRMLHAGPPSSPPIDEYVKPLLSYKPGGGENVICDRWHLGEVVYPRVTGRPSEMTPGLLRSIEVFLASRGALLVHVFTSPLEMERRFASRGDPIQTLDVIRRAADEFRIAVRASTLTKMSWPFYTPEHIVSQALAAEQRALARW